MAIVETQMAFAQNVAALIRRAGELGYGVTLGDCYRDPRCPYGSKSSKHRRRLAIDLNLFMKVGGEWRYIMDDVGHRDLGVWWESIGGVWGGSFEDPNHYEWPI